MGIELIMKINDVLKRETQYFLCDLLTICVIRLDRLLKR